MKFLKIGPTILRVVRVFKIFRLFKIVKSVQGLRNIIRTIIYSLPSLLHIGAILFLVLFIYSVLGSFLFGTMKHEGDAINDFYNFDNFFKAFLIMFGCATGDSWYVFMNDVAQDHSVISPIFFMSFYNLCSLVLLNMFILIIIQ